MPAWTNEAAPIEPVSLAQPTLSRPAGASCTVSLLDGMVFRRGGDSRRIATTPAAFEYRPPADCPGPWAKVVLEADFNVAAGRQFDRTASLWLGGVNIYYGTTQEPSATRGASWHVERDLSSYASALRQPRAGRVVLNNWVDGTYTSPITLSARLVFYPASATAPVSVAADAVIPLAGEQAGTPTSLAEPGDALQRSLQLPRNVVAAYLDVIAQSQGNDEPWYTCVPDADIAATARFALEAPYDGAPLQQCGKSSFRMVELRIDDRPAALAPVFPWTYTGGIDPHLWRPAPSVQSLNFMPYRLDLSPFAALLSDGQPHRFALRVLGANHFFNVAANLLIYQDARLTEVRGGLLRNSLVGLDLQPQIERALRYRDGRTDGKLEVTQRSHYVIEGYIDTPQGRRRTRVEQTLDFANRQRFSTPGSGHYLQTITQDSDSQGEMRQWLGDRLQQRRSWHWQAPLRLRVDKQLREDDSFDAGLTMSQSFKLQRSGAPDDTQTTAAIEDRIDAADIVHLNAVGDHVIDHHDQHSEQRYEYQDARGGCYRRTLRNVDEQALALSQDPACAAIPDWRAYTDGAP